MDKIANIKLKTLVFISGVMVVGIATAAVKLVIDPKWEIFWAFIATGGVALVALSKYM